VHVTHDEVAGAKHQAMHAKTAAALSKVRLDDRRTALAGATDYG